MIVDSFNRIHTYLRISLTDHCNLRCSYCMPDEDQVFAPAERLMQLDEIVTLARIFVNQGVTKIRLTGGEPLVRKDAAQIITELGKLPVSLGITTNATRVHEFIDVFKEAGIQSVNISLDTLDRDKFRMITRRDQFDQVMENISLLLRTNFRVKINAVILNGVNDDEIPAFINWTKNLPIDVRFIEFMPFEGNHWNSKQVFTWQQIVERVMETGDAQAIQSEANDTAKCYKLPGYAGSFSVISTMSAPFCSSCNRMRLTADGKMKNCLFSKHEADLLSILRSGGDILPVIRTCMMDKAELLGGQIKVPFDDLNANTITNRSMIAIGG